MGRRRASEGPSGEASATARGGLEDAPTSVATGEGSGAPSERASGPAAGLSGVGGGGGSGAVAAGVRRTVAGPVPGETQTTGRFPLGGLVAELAADGSDGSTSGAARSYARELAQAAARPGEREAARLALADARAALARGDGRACLDRVLAALGGIL